MKKNIKNCTKIENNQNPNKNIPSINMMDVSMYGNHSAHTSGYQNSDMNASGYAYFPNHHHHHLHHHHSHNLNESESGYTTNNLSTTVTTNSSSNCTTPVGTTSGLNTHLYTHPHLYSPSAAEYGITTTSQLSTNNSPSEPYYDADSAHSYYNATSGPSPGAIQDPHIISTDNGLSYTNLDYMYNQNPHNPTGYQIHPDDKVHHYNLSDNMLLGHSPTQSNQSSSSVPSWHHPSYIDSTLSHSIGLSNLSGQNQINSLNNTTNSVDINHSSATSPSLQHQSQQQQQNIQTYKWMQVKRNVPKPQGTELYLNSLFYQIPSNVVVKCYSCSRKLIYLKLFTLSVKLLYRRFLFKVIFFKHKCIAVVNTYKKCINLINNYFALSLKMRSNFKTIEYSLNFLLLHICCFKFK